VRTFVLELDEAARRHLLDALDRHARWLRERCYRMPPALASFGVALAARSGQKGTPLDDGKVNGEPVDHEPPTLLDYDQAGRVLSVSARQVRRLVAEGALATVSIGRRRLVPRVELTRFVEQETR
jgi:excisionase family DNA binding protein